MWWWLRGFEGPAQKAGQQAAAVCGLSVCGYVHLQWQVALGFVLGQLVSVDVRLGGMVLVEVVS